MYNKQHITYRHTPKKTGQLDFKLALILLAFFCLIAVLAPVISGESTQKLIPFSPGQLDHAHPYSPPGSESMIVEVKHWLGTDALGRDLLAGIIHGSRTALIIGIGSALVSLMFGLIFGMIFGYYGNDRLRMNKSLIWKIPIYLIVFLYLTRWLLFLQEGQHRTAFWIVIILMFISLLFLFMISIYMKMNKRETGRESTSIHLDSLSMRFLDLFKSLPALFILLVLLRLIDSPGMIQLILIISFLLWPVFARHARAEMLNWRNKPFVLNSVLQGRSDFKIIFRELTPFIIRPLIVSAAFMAASALLLEATLSFLGIGIAVDHISWGTLINDARSNTQAWWLIVFPGICLFLLIWSLQTIGRYVHRKAKAETQWRTN